MGEFKRVISISLALVISLFLFYSPAEAAFNVSVTPYEGGYDLRFDKVSALDAPINKEAVVRITSDIGKQYQLVQMLFEPLTNAQGISLPQNNLYVYGIRGSNKYGILAAEHEIPVFLGRSVLYTSNANGWPDDFILVYSLREPFNVPSGHYSGRIAFILEPVDAIQEPVTFILNIFADIQAEAGISLTTASGFKVISLSSKRDAGQAEDVLLEIEGGLGQPFRILQQLAHPLRAADGRELPAEAIEFIVSGTKQGSSAAQFRPLSFPTSELYRSGTRGEAESFVITYSLGDLSLAKAGRYSTNITYLLEESLSAQTGTIDSLALEIEIERVFDILLETESAAGAIEFRDLRPDQPPRTFEVIIEVKTNIGRQYQVTQNMVSALVSQQGHSVPAKHLKFITESIKTKGVLKLPKSAEARQGDTVLFVSDREGSPDKFRIIYELEPSWEIPAGDYSTSMVYSLSEL